MLAGAFLFRLPPADWRPPGWVGPAADDALVTTYHAHINQALRTAQFHLLWSILPLNVTAGLGVLG